MRRLLLCGALVLGCDSPFGPDAYAIRMQVRDLVPCETGAFSGTTCMQSRTHVWKDTWTEWRPQREGIRGFEHEPGFHYELSVRQRELENPPADGSSIEMSLIRVISKRQSSCINC
jgi:hypothetical protein